MHNEQTDKQTNILLYIYRFKKKRLHHSLPVKYSTSIQWLNIKCCFFHNFLLSLDETLFNNNTLKKQISLLVIRITDNRERNSSNQLYALIFTQIFAMFTNLKYLNFKPSFICSQQLLFDISAPIFFSSILSELHVNVGWHEDCFVLLDGRFDQLHALYVNIYFPIPKLSIINNMIRYLH